MYANLCAEFKETKESLKNVEETIRRLTGRDPDSFDAAGDVKWKNGVPGKKEGQILSRKRSAVADQNISEDLAIEEESSDEEVPKKKPAVQSAVIPMHKVVKSRKDTLAEQKGDKRGLARNKRMFGLILGTLMKFQSEESRRKDQVIKKAKIDRKVEEAAEKEKELMQKEKQELFVARKKKQIKVRCLEKKLEVAETHHIWEKNYKFMKNFTQTSAKPRIMYLPRKHNEKSLKRLHHTREGISALINARKRRLEKELADIEESYKRDTLDVESENVGGKENFKPNAEQGESKGGIKISEDVIMKVKVDKHSQDLMKMNIDEELESDSGKNSEYVESNLDESGSTDALNVSADSSGIAFSSEDVDSEAADKQSEMGEPIKKVRRSKFRNYDEATLNESTDSSEILSSSGSLNSSGYSNSSGSKSSKSRSSSEGESSSKVIDELSLSESSQADHPRRNDRERKTNEHEEFEPIYD